MLNRGFGWTVRSCTGVVFFYIVTHKNSYQREYYSGNVGKRRSVWRVKEWKGYTLSRICQNLVWLLSVELLQLAPFVFFIEVFSINEWCVWVQELLTRFDSSFSTMRRVMFSQQCSVGAAGGRPALPQGAVFIVSTMCLGSLMASQLGQAYFIK